MPDALLGPGHAAENKTNNCSSDRVDRIVRRNHHNNKRIRNISEIIVVE